MSFAPRAEASSGTSALTIDLRAVSRSYGSVHAVDAVTLGIDAGEFVALIGPSGCGKTTLLRMIGGLDAPDSGEIAYREHDRVLSAELALQRAAICFQEPRLLPWRSVLANVELPLELLGVERDERRERAMASIGRMRLGDAADRLPSQLSGGMRMRAAMARALVTRPRLLLLDEPFGALDEVTRQELDEELYALWEQDRFTAVLVTHSIPEAVFLASRCVVFSPRPARVLVDRSIAIDDHSTSVRTSDDFNEHVRFLSTALLSGMRSGRSR